MAELLRKNCANVTCLCDLKEMSENEQKRKRHCTKILSQKLDAYAIKIIPSKVQLVSSYDNHNPINKLPLGFLLHNKKAAHVN